MGIDTIWKFRLQLIERQTIEIPVDARLLNVDRDPELNLCIWAAVDAKGPSHDMEIIIVGTGKPLPHVGSFLGTVKTGAFVWHVFTGPGHALEPGQNFHYLTKDNGDGR